MWLWWYSLSLSLFLYIYIYIYVCVCGRVSCLGPQLAGIVCFSSCFTDLFNPTSGKDASHMCLISLSPRHVYHYYTCSSGKGMPYPGVTKPCGRCEACHLKGRTLQACPKRTILLMGTCLRKKQKIHTGMLNNLINYIFIDIITILHYIHL